MVTKSVPDNSVVAGIPARVIESIDDYCDHLQKKGCLYPTIGMDYEKKRAFFDRMQLRETYFREEAE